MEMRAKIYVCVRLPPDVRQRVKTLLAVRWKYSTGKTTLPQNHDWLVKQRRSLLESKPPRNSQPETHPDNKWGRGRK